MPNLNVLLEDNHLLVINKDAGVVTQGSLPHQVSLVDLAKDYLKKKYRKPGNVYLGIVSRLDSQVTGVVVLARTSKAARRLSEQFRESTVTKKYWALVQDNLPGTEGTMVDYLVKNEAQKRMTVADPANADASRAELNWRVLADLGRSALVEIDLITGRKHQIRVQFSARDCHITGDRKYGDQHSFPKGIGLHSRSITFQHPTSGDSLTVECDPPAYWPIADLETGF